MKTRKPFIRQFRNETPFLRLFIAFTAGIITQIFYPETYSRIPFMLFFMLSFLLIIHTNVKRLSASWKLKTKAGIVFNAVFFLAGIYVTFFNTESFRPMHIGNYMNTDQVYLASILKPITEKPSSYKTVVEVIAVKKNNKWNKVSGKVLVYLKKEERSASLKYGDMICFSSMPVRIKEPLNPEEFNYRQFLSFHQIYHQAYLKDSYWKKLSFSHGNKIIAAAYQVRSLFIQILRDNIPGKREFAVASALVVGYQDEVDQELISAYSSAGALHVLSVSGMHVGLIYQGLVLLLGFMNKRRWSRHVLYAFLICFIWFYAFLTGFSPSVARSALMISLVIFGKWSSKGTNVFNTMLVTAFFLLIYDPYYITEVGFQLSFLAVWGIIYFHPKIFLWLEPSGKFLHWVWEITSISLAAQLMTFPLGLLYFHQFPNLFMLSNLIVIPLSSIIIYACIAVLCFSPVAFLCNSIGKLTGYLLLMLNDAVLVIEQLPGSILSNIHILAFEALLMYMIIACISSFFTERKGYFMQLALFLTATLIAIQLFEKTAHVKQKQLIVYSIPKQSAIDLVYGENNVLITDSNFVSDKQGLLFHIKHNWIMLGLKNNLIITRGENDKTKIQEYGEIMLLDNFLFFENKRIFLANKKSIEKLLKCNPLKKKKQVEYIIVSENAIKNITDLSDYFDFKQVILDSSNSKWKAEKWIRQGSQSGVTCYSVLHQGAYIEKM